MANGLFNLKQVMQAVQQGGWTAQKTPAVQYLVVAGGGGGGSYGGGGAGGLLTGIDPVPNGQTLLVTVGGGGNGGDNGVNGSNSVFGNITAIGGGAGNYNTAGSSGGSGGGAGVVGGSSERPGQGIFGQGNAGGYSSPSNTTYYPAGGGGGAGTNGINGAITGVYAGNGGAGVASSISGTNTTYAGGGGGGAWQSAGGTVGGTGGVGGGGNGGGQSGGTGTAGTANTGGGGGGLGNGGGNGYNGGSGIVIVSYPDVYAAPTATTGSPTVSTSGSGSVYFNSTYISYPNSSAFTLTGDYTIEGWFNLTNISASPSVFCLGSSTDTSTYGILLYYSAGANSFRLYTGGNAIINGPTISNNTWYHFAVVRSGSGSNNTVLYLNGTSVGTATNNFSFAGLTQNGFAVGGEYSTIFYPSNSYATNIRITKSALYTGAFTPSSIPLAAITNTSFLLNATSGAYLTDSSGGLNPTIYASSSTSWNASSPFTVTGYKNRVYTWTSSGSITF